MLLNGNIFNIERSSLHDGNGIRTVVYLKGCPLHCFWCHNPEGIKQKTEFIYQKEKCVFCKNCVHTCPSGCYSAVGDSLVHSYDECIGCLSCSENCPSNALTAFGRQMSLEEVMTEVIKDKVYYDQTCGGVTLSGGECLLQPEFSSAILQQCKEHQINTLIESSFCVPFENIIPVLPYTDCFFVDVKHMDSSVHKEYTGQGNELILENIHRLSSKYSIVLRVPVIPLVNDSMDNLLKTGKFAVENGIKKIELLKYNGLAKTKYRLLKKEFHDFSGAEQDLKALCAQLNCNFGQENLFYSD